MTSSTSAAPTTSAGPTTSAPIVPTIPKKYEFTTGNGFSTYPKFNGTNYLLWKTNITTRLKALNQWAMVLGSITKPTDPEELGDWLLHRDCCINEIISRIEEGFKNPVANTENLARVWAILEEHYGIKDQPVTEAYWVRIITQSLYDSETPIQDHYKAMLEAFTKQAEAGGNMTERQFRTHFINSLPNQYEAYILGLDSKVPVSEIVNQLKGSETRKVLRQSEAAAFVVRVKIGSKPGGSKGGGGGSARKREGKCRKCGQEGHWECDNTCPQKGSGGSGGSSNHDKSKKFKKGSNSGGGNGTGGKTQPTPTSHMFSAIASTELAAAATDVVRVPHIVDSGALDHWLLSRMELHNYRDLETPITIETAGGKMYACGVGDLQFCSSCN